MAAGSCKPERRDASCSRNPPLPLRSHHEMRFALAPELLRPLSASQSLPPPVACVQSTRAGCILNIPGIVMGTIVLSSGTSVPDSLSSIVVARKGEGDMAIANVPSQTCSASNILVITKFLVHVVTADGV
ncbi:hypothetical protein EMIHUDRAFT_212884 [Emiliania huxleyi CCMP1516]|uniref:Sodium/calcium exchanger membrane region domain-containing protein n=2 Tax=Emiliania huxleyi TaxID=2903 RepID=A0A0D3IPF7_EMIH1|nr:hypothetical protein EMIHUDRAFT_212884 [Emiliania huxleyi CCMP1516]EOD13142.1 hypothetical protein EMIHUDRAFT_212884 [Emiliania huxleyi CCMP1516]|eukprot:XP_005765571.1 hypothetical protein EMIHUDRAFT_212884 [Emiliania huxleyi CCMP1516]